LNVFGPGDLQDGRGYTGSENTLIGAFAGEALAHGGSNTLVGYSAGKMMTDYGNSFFGYRAGANLISGSGNSFFGVNAGLEPGSGSSNSFFGGGSGINMAGRGNSFFGEGTGKLFTTGDNNSLLGSRADLGANGLSYATAIGAEAKVNTSNTIALGRTDGSDTVLVYGKLQIDTMAAAGSTQLCLNGSNRVGTCSSSLRYKTNLAPYNRGLNIINRLRPISFTWKDGGLRDLGFGAEEVEKVDPLLVTYNKQGQVEGVKYDRINVALVNAVKEQQQEIESLRKANAFMAARLQTIEQKLAKKPRQTRR
jgi:hypothetical protein